jgi:hypothetical protein
MQILSGSARANTSNRCGKIVWIPEQSFGMNPGSGTQTKAQMVAGQTAGAKTYPDIIQGEGPDPTEFRLMSVYNNGNFATAVDHTLFKVHLNSAGKPDFEHVPPNNKTDQPLVPQRNRQTRRGVRSDLRARIRKKRWHVEARGWCFRHASNVQITAQRATKSG